MSIIITDANKSVKMLISFSSRIYVLIMYAIELANAIDDASNSNLGINPL